MLVKRILHNIHISWKELHTFQWPIIRIFRMKIARHIAFEPLFPALMLRNEGSERIIRTFALG